MPCVSIFMEYQNRVSGSLELKSQVCFGNKTWILWKRINALNYWAISLAKKDFFLICSTLTLIFCLLIVQTLSFSIKHYVGFAEVEADDMKWASSNPCYFPKLSLPYANILGQSFNLWILGVCRYSVHKSRSNSSI